MWIVHTPRRPLVAKQLWSCTRWPHLLYTVYSPGFICNVIISRLFLLLNKKNRIVQWALRIRAIWNFRIRIWIRHHVSMYYKIYFTIQKNTNLNMYSRKIFRSLRIRIHNTVMKTAIYFNSELIFWNILRRICTWHGWIPSMFMNTSPVPQDVYEYQPCTTECLWIPALYHEDVL